MKVLVLSLAVLLAVSTNASAALIEVTGTGPNDCTLADAVALANGPDSATQTFCVRAGDQVGVEDPVDFITFAATVPNVVPVDETLRVAGGLTITGGGRIVLETDVSQRIFEITAPTGTEVTLDGLTLRSTGLLLVSGGVRVASGTLVVRGTTFDANRGVFGGALHVDAGASLDVRDSAFTNNQARRGPVDICMPTRPNLRTADSYAVLGGSGVSNTGLTMVTGDLGVSPGTAITGFPPGLVFGVVHDDDAVAGQAHADAQSALTDGMALSLCATTVDGNVGGLTLTPGLYTSTSSLNISAGDLVLDAQGNSAALFVFQTGSTMVTTSNRQVMLVNGAQAANVYWFVGSSATVGTGSHMVGTVIAQTSITMTTGASLLGRALSIDGAVTLDTNAITRPIAPELGSELSGLGLLAGAVEGGAVDCLGTCDFNRVLFAGNRAIGLGFDGDASGGALSAFGATVTLTNTTFVDNHAQAGLSDIVGTATAAHGGAVAAVGGTLRTSFATFTDNGVARDLEDTRALASGGALYLTPALAGDYTIHGAIIADNTLGATAGSDCVVTGEESVITTYSLFADEVSRTDCDGDDATNVVGVVDLLGLDDNGGVTQTVRFAPTSLALDGVPTLLCGAAGGLDQRGYLRPVTGACDIGALELENLALAITAPASYLIPGGATAPQTISLDYTVSVDDPAMSVDFTFTVASGVTAVVLDADGVAVAGCVAGGAGVITCPLGALLADGVDGMGTITLTFPATRTADIPWDGLITFGFADADALDDADRGVIAILFCGDGTVTPPETCDDMLAAGGCNAVCDGCEPGFTGADCLTCVGLDDGNPCTDDVCDPALGALHTDNTAACDDGDVCTTSSVCALGACVGSGALAVDDGNPCTDDTCDATLGAVHTNNTSTCDDGDQCTSGDRCAAGACVGGAAVVVDDGNPCTDDACSALTGVTHSPNTASCDDDNACSTDDVCGAGVCGGDALDIDDGDSCTADSCDPVSGEVHVRITTGACAGLHEAGGGGCAGGDTAGSLLALMACAGVLVGRRRYARLTR